MSSSSADSRLRPPSGRRPGYDQFRILSIDGGGIRGVIPAVFLERLEELLRATLEQAKADPTTAQIAARWHGVNEPASRIAFT